MNEEFQVRVRCRHGRKMWAPARAFVTVGMTDLVDGCSEAKDERILADMERDLARQDQRRTMFRFWRR